MSIHFKVQIVGGVRPQQYAIAGSTKGATLTNEEGCGEAIQIGYDIIDSAHGVVGALQDTGCNVLRYRIRQGLQKNAVRSGITKFATPLDMYVHYLQ